MSERALTSPPCVYGDRGSKVTMVLFGDSHAMQLFPALETVAQRRGWRLVQLTKAGCPPAAVRVVSPLSRREYPQCKRWQAHALGRIEAEHPAIVVAAGSAHHQIFSGGSKLGGRAAARKLAEGQLPMLRRLRAIAKKVVVVSDPPRPRIDVPDCVSESLHELRKCAFPREPAVAKAQLVSAAARRVRGVLVLDPTDQYCLADLCPGVIGNVLVYRNSGHVTATFARTLAPWFGRRLPRAPS